VETATQTNKTRYARWENASEVFQLTAPEKLIGKHILLVDDIVTTGATIESAAQQLIHIDGIKISIACLGYATY
jgi:predicted amidophosphoribosyltransferase